jgi:serine/threonine protein kinase
MSDPLNPGCQPPQGDKDGASTSGTVPSAHPGAPHRSAGAGWPQIGGFVILKLLGEGGMGAVYLAEDARLGRRVAIKTMRPELAANRLDRERFLREARAAAAVEHDNIVPIWHVGEAEDGTAFIVMPFLQGETLDARLRREPVSPPGLVLKVAGEVAEGLAAAHATGLTHRDIKPANIWLEGGPSGEQVRRCKILDFGLARSVDKEEAQITASGAILGTPAYMAPEQARGEKVDHRADLFSLGATLYRMATGRLPFDGPTPMAVLIALTTEAPLPLRETAPGLLPELAGLIDRLMSKKREDRPQSASEVAARVRQISDALQSRKRIPPWHTPAAAESLPNAGPRDPISTS